MCLLYAMDRNFLTLLGSTYCCYRRVVIISLLHARSDTDSPQQTYDGCMDVSYTSGGQTSAQESPVLHEPFYGHGRRNSAQADMSQMAPMTPREKFFEEYLRTENIPLEYLARHGYINLTSFGAVDHLHGALAQTPETTGNAHTAEDRRRGRSRE